MPTYPVPAVVEKPNPPGRKLYFNNNAIEDLLTTYVQGGCMSVALRDEILSHTDDLIRQIILTKRFHSIYTGRNAEAFNDLVHVAYMQIERTLFKYRARPHCAKCYDWLRPNYSALYTPAVDEYGILTPEDVAARQLRCPKCGELPDTILYRGTGKVFNLWSQVISTVILAYIKKDGRDKKNATAYDEHKKRAADAQAASSGALDKFLDEAEEVCKYDATYSSLVRSMRELVASDPQPEQGFIGKLTKRSGVPRARVTKFLHYIRCLGDSFTAFRSKSMDE